jgi:hypothetical protein
VAIRTRVEPLSRDVELIISEDLSPKAQSAALAAFHAQEIDDAKQINRSVLGRIPPSRTFVDGKEGGHLESVRPDGVIVTEFDLFTDVLIWIGDQLEKHSPVGGKGDRHPGLYRKSHALFADGQLIDVGGVIPFGAELVFINLVPYARKIERGSSSQAPDGVYQAVATLAQRRFGNIAKITFSYRTAMGGSIIGGRAGNKSDQRNPAIIVKLRES